MLGAWRHPHQYAREFWGTLLQRLIVKMPRVLDKSFALCLAAFLAYLTFDQAWLQWKFRVPFPHADMVTIVKLLDANSSPTILDLYRSVGSYPFAEHLMVAPFFFYLWDRYHFASTGELLYRAIFIFNALLILSFVFSAGYTRRKLGVAYSALFSAIIAYWFFAAFNYDNLTWQVQIHEVSSGTYLSFGLLLAAMVSTYNVISGNHIRDLMLAALAGIFLLVATFSFGFGLVGWPLVFAHALMTRWRLAPLLMFGAFAALAIGAYAYWFAVSELNAAHTPLGSALQQPLGVVKVSLNVLAWPFSYIFEGFVSQRLSRLMAISVVLGGCGLAAACIGRIYLTQLGYVAERAIRVFSFHAALMVLAALGIALMIGLARVGWYHSYGESRYGVVSSIFACGLLTLLVLELRGIFANISIFVFGILTAIMGFVCWQQYEQIIAERDQRLYQAGVLATYRLDFAPSMPSLYFISPDLYQVWHRSRTPDPSFAEREPFKWIGHSLSELPEEDLSLRCLGQAGSVVPLEGVSRLIILEGWAVVAAADDRLRWVLVSEADDNVIGAGRPGLPSPEVRNHLKAAGLPVFPTEAANAKFQIAAFVTSGKPLVLRGVTSDGKTCRVSAVRRE
jgi:hypothetical protein